MGENGIESVRNAAAPGDVQGVRTTTPQLQSRKHLTTEGTETAARATLGDDVQVVRNIRTLPLATSKLE